MWLHDRTGIQPYGVGVCGRGIPIDPGGAQTRDERWDSVYEVGPALIQCLRGTWITSASAQPDLGVICRRVGKGTVNNSVSSHRPGYYTNLPCVLQACLRQLLMGKSNDVCNNRSPPGVACQPHCGVV